MTRKAVVLIGVTDGSIFSPVYCRLRAQASSASGYRCSRSPDRLSAFIELIALGRDPGPYGGDWMRSGWNLYVSIAAGTRFYGRALNLIWRAIKMRSLHNSSALHKGSDRLWVDPWFNPRKSVAYIKYFITEIHSWVVRSPNAILHCQQKQNLRHTWTHGPGREMDGKEPETKTRLSRRSRPPWSPCG